VIALSGSRPTGYKIGAAVVSRLACEGRLGPQIWPHAVRFGKCQRGQPSPSMVAIASIEIRRPRGRATLAGAERAGGGSGM
jgi:hypothetical protein